MNFIDICSGIGGFRTGLERNGHNCVAFAEIDKFAIQSYKAIYNTENEVELGDITTMDDSEWEQFKGNCDMIVGGTPCQSFSIAGKRLGFEDTRGTVFFSYVNAIKQVQPKYFLFENVKGLMSHDKGNTIKVILKAFDEVGYDLDFEVFNSKHYGVPQNRERIYIVGIRKDLSDKPFKPVSVGKKKMDSLKAWATCEVSYKQIHPALQTEVTTRLIDVLEDEVDEKYYLSDEKTKKLTLDNDLGGKLNMYEYRQRDEIHSINKVSPTLNTMQGGDRQPKIAIKGFKEVVKVRKYDVNKLELSELLRISKQNAGISNKEISNTLNVPITKVEHWFRSDKSFSIPDAEIWLELKTLLNITNTEHDEAVTTFEEKESEFDTTNRIYDTEYLSPTLNTTSEPKIAINQLGNIVDNKETFGVNQGVVMKDIRIRKLTPLECWRLQGFTDEQFYKAKDSGVSNSQLYKQAGNSVTVNVVDAIVKELK